MVFKFSARLPSSALILRLDKIESGVLASTMIWPPARQMDDEVGPKEFAVRFMARLLGKITMVQQPGQFHDAPQMNLPPGATVRRRAQGR